MKRLVFIAASLLFALAVMLGAGCDKEKIVESTEYVHDIEYVELPGDTVYRTDTVYNYDSVSIHTTDTLYRTDTVVQTNHIYDTVMVHDTINTVQQHYDTVVVIDTVETVSFEPNDHTAFGALQYYSDPLVLEFINSEFGISDGWVFYLSAYQLDLTRQSEGVYDIYGFIDYWTPDWESYYPLEYFWRMTYTGGDPALPLNWELTEPPASSAGHQPGVSRNNQTAASELILH